VTEPPVSVAIVGAGPRGTVMLDRICANAALVPRGRHVDVHLVDPHPPGAGRVWHEAQNRRLMMNTVSADITVFTDDSVLCAGPVRPGPNQYQWARMVATGEISGLDEHTLAEARTIEPWSYASRAFQGSYLCWAVRHIVETAPPAVRIHMHRTRAIALEDLPGGRQSLWLDDRQDALEVDAVVLAQGHYDVAPTTGQRELIEFAARRDLVYVPPASPSEVDLTAIGAGEPVVLRGLGLNFFDYLVLLTAGRGGRFSRDGNDRLTYQPSGAEPRLYAGSGRGVPHSARAELRQEVVPRYQARFLTKEVIAALRRNAGTGRTDFMADLWPYIAKEAGWVYYGHLLRHGDAADPVALARFEAEYPGLAWDSPELDALLATLVPDPALRWNWDDLDRPAAGLRFADRAEFLAWVRDRLAHDHRRARLGPTGNALKATTSMMRDLRDSVRQVISHRGISGVSYDRHVDQWFSGLSNFVASGPPASRIEELCALIDAGVVRLVGPNMRISTDEAGFFLASSPAVQDEPVHATSLIEAHLPVPDLRTATDPLLRYLLDRGQCRPHAIPNPDGSQFQTGGLDITEDTQQVITATGTPHHGRFSLGPPVESVQWVTAIAPRPHVNARVLLQCDVIARTALANSVQNRPAALTMSGSA
jgi:uncharacterized NAD(P)/FAD-binding protein YdhS